MSEPSSKLIAYLGYVALLALVLLHIVIKLLCFVKSQLQSCINKNKNKNKNKQESSLEDILLDSANDTCKVAKAKPGVQVEVEQKQAQEQEEQQENDNPEPGIGFNINQQEIHLKSGLDIACGLSNLINSAVFLYYFDFFVTKKSDSDSDSQQHSFVFIVCLAVWIIKIIIWLSYLVNNCLISQHCINKNKSSTLFYYNISINMLEYKLNVFDSFFKIYYSFPFESAPQAIVFWNITFSLANALKNWLCLSVTYGFKGISLITDAITELYQSSCSCSCVYKMQLTMVMVEQLIKMIVLLPIFIVMNMFTAGLALTINSASYASLILLASSWLLGSEIGWLILKLTGSAFARALYMSLLLYVNLVNFIILMYAAVCTLFLCVISHESYGNYLYYCITSSIVYLVYNYFALILFVPYVYQKSCCCWRVFCRENEKGCDHIGCLLFMIAIATAFPILAAFYILHPGGTFFLWMFVISVIFNIFALVDFIGAVGDLAFVIYI